MNDRLGNSVWRLQMPFSRTVSRVLLTAASGLFVATAASAANIAVVQGGDAIFNVNEAGRVSAITGLNVNGASHVSYHATKSNSQLPALISLVVADSTAASLGSATIIEPASFSTLGGNQYSVVFPNSITATVRIEPIAANASVPNARGYVKMTLTALTNSGTKDVRALTWGPIPVALSERVGDLAGVVYGRDFALGITGLNIQSTGGIPGDYRSQFTSQWTWANPDGTTPGGRFTIAFSSARALSNGNATLQVSTMDYSVARSARYGFDNPSGTERPIQANSSPEAKIVGSSIALYGVARTATFSSRTNLRDAFRQEILTTIESIEKNEGLPYSKAGGVWAKSSQENVQRILGMENTGLSTIGTVKTQARAGGFGYLYQWSANNGIFNDAAPFFTPNAAFGGSYAGLNGIYGSGDLPLGSHTLTGFAFVGDPVTNTAAHSQLSGNADKLLERTRTTLAAAASASATTITVNDVNNAHTQFSKLGAANWKGRPRCMALPTSAVKSLSIPGSRRQVLASSRSPGCCGGATAPQLPPMPTAARFATWSGGAATTHWLGTMPTQYRLGSIWGTPWSRAASSSPVWMASSPSIKASTDI